MAKLTGTGAPSVKLEAAIGDIYTDTKNGKQYKCTFAHKDGRTHKYEAQWETLDSTDEEPEVLQDAKESEDVHTEKADEEQETILDHTDTEPEKPTGNTKYYKAYNK